MPKQQFNILVPFMDIRQIPLLKAAGADELYCGYVTPEFSKNWPLAFHSINRRGEGSSFTKMPTFRAALKEARQARLPVYVTVNALYTAEQYPYLHRLVKILQDLEGLSGLIVADIGFLLFLKQIGFKKEIHISTGGTAFNSSSLDFFKQLGAKRVVLDRQLSFKEIRQIILGVKSPLDIELFILSEPCGGFIDGLCNFYHCAELDKERKVCGEGKMHMLYRYKLDPVRLGCQLYTRALSAKRFKTYSAITGEPVQSGLRLRPEKSLPFGCRLCELYDLKDLPVKSLKIVGRGIDSGYILRLAGLLSRCLDGLSQGMSREEYRRFCRDLLYASPLRKKRRCSRLDCYFPRP